MLHDFFGNNLCESKRGKACKQEVLLICAPSELNCMKNICKIPVAFQRTLASILTSPVVYAEVGCPRQKSVCKNGESGDCAKIEIFVIKPVLIPGISRVIIF